MTEEDRNHPAEAIKCPMCGSLPRMPCVSPWTKRTRSPHRARWIAAGLIDSADRVPEERR